MRNLRRILAYGLIAAFIVACSGGRSAAPTSAAPTGGGGGSQAIPTSADGGSVNGSAHYEITGDFIASGDVNFSPPPRLEVVSGALARATLSFFSVGVGYIQLQLQWPSNQPGVGQLVLQTADVQVATNRLDASTGATPVPHACTFDIGPLTQTAGAGTIQCDAVDAKVLATGVIKSVRIKVTFSYHG